MTIKLTIKNDDTRENAVVSVERHFGANHVEHTGTLKGGESKAVYISHGVTLVVKEIQNG